MKPSYAWLHLMRKQLLPVFNTTVNNSQKILTELHFYEIGHLADKYSSLTITVFSLMLL